MNLQIQCCLLFAVATFCTAASINKGWRYSKIQDTTGRKPQHLASVTWLTDETEQEVDGLDTAAEVGVHMSKNAFDLETDTAHTYVYGENNNMNQRDGNDDTAGQQSTDDLEPLDIGENQNGIQVDGKEDTSGKPLYLTANDGMEVDSNYDTAGKLLHLTSNEGQELENEDFRENLDIDAAAPVAKGIQFNYLESDIVRNGLVKCYDQPYSSPTTSSNLAACSQSDYVFVGAKSCSDATIFAVGAFGSSSSIFKATASSTTAILDAAGSVFWYRLSGASFGFASSSSVSLNSCDTNSQDCGSRLCWHLDQNAGGYRAGCTLGLNADSKWRKIIYMYKAGSPPPTPLTTTQPPTTPVTTKPPPTTPVVVVPTTKSPLPNQKAPCSVLYNYAESSLNAKGYIKCYDQPYSFSTSSAELAACSGSQYVFVGAKSTCDATTFAVGAYGITTKVFGTTASMSTAYQDAAGGAFWYRVSGASFGFASSSSVSLSSCDTSSLDCSSRLCWHLDQNSGGYRAGCTTGLNGDAKWRKVIYKGNATPTCV